MALNMRARLILVCVVITTASLLALAAVNYWMKRSHVLQTQDANISQVAHLHADNLAAWVQDKMRTSAAIEKALTAEAPVLVLETLIQAGGFDDAYVVWADKRVVSPSEFPAGYDGTQRPWYVQAAQAGKPVLTPAYVDAKTGKLTITFAHPIGPVGAPQAVWGADILLDSIVQVVSSIRPTERSVAFLVDGNGKILAHTDAAQAGKEVRDVAGLDVAALQQSAGQKQRTWAQLQDMAYDLYPVQVQGAPWVLVVGVDAGAAAAVLRPLLWGSAVVALLCLIAAVGLVTLAVTQQMKRLLLVRDALVDIASGEGDLTQRLRIEGQDEIAQIGSAFNSFVEKIATVLLRIRDASGEVHTATGEIASGNHDLSVRTEQQASSLEQTAAAMEQLTSTVQQNAENAQQASALAASASSIASRGGDVVQQVVHSMAGIDQSSKKIAEITGVIDAIAFQTNILALNAAVEAARAGDQGRGFAVVATEVRTLAQRSATAAKEIKQLITDSVQQVSAGSEQVRFAGQTMDEVVSSVQRVTAIVEEISHASQEQSRGIAEVGNAIATMDQGTQQNAALVEQASAASQALRQQAVQLAQAVAGFKLQAGQQQANSRALVHD